MKVIAVIERPAIIRQIRSAERSTELTPKARNEASIAWASPVQHPNSARLHIPPMP